MATGDDIIWPQNLNLLHDNLATSKKKEFLMIIQKAGTLAIATQNLIFHHSLMEITKVFWMILSMTAKR